MKHNVSRIRFILFVIVVSAVFCLADNPIVQTIYTADPAPLVHEGVMYAYVGHDEDGSGNWFDMKDWRVFSTTDAVNWTDRGVALNLATFSWARADAWAGHVISRNGKFYYYVTVRLEGEPCGIGVAVSDKPEGPFIDAVGQPLVSGVGYIDPTVFIDDDGQAYLYFGNPILRMIKLNSDMVSTSGSIVDLSQPSAGFNHCYLEGPWAYKRNGMYYMNFSSQCVQGWEDIRYSTSTSPTGPWTYRGIVQAVQVDAKSWTNHSGIVDFKGNSYLFYHNGDLPGGGHVRRSVGVEQFQYNADGTIPQIPMTKSGPNQIGHVNPYDTVQAETIAWSVGLQTGKSSDAGIFVDSIHSGDYIKVRGVDFGSGAKSFDARVASGSAGGSIELHLDALTGILVGTCEVQGTGGWQIWTTQSCSVSGATGIHDLFLKFTGASGRLFSFNWWKFVSDSSNSDSNSVVGAQFYQFSNFDGLSTKLAVGNYTLSQLQGVGIPDNAVNSMKVDPGIAVEIFDNDNFQVSLGVFNNSVPDFSSANLAGKLSSIRISDSPLRVKDQNIGNSFLNLSIRGNVLLLKIEKPIRGSIEILGINGHIYHRVPKISYSAGTHSLRLGGVPDGIVIVKISSDQGTYLKTIVP